MVLCLDLANQETVAAHLSGLRGLAVDWTERGRPSLSNFNEGIYTENHDWGGKVYKVSNQFLRMLSFPSKLPEVEWSELEWNAAWMVKGRWLEMSHNWFVAPFCPSEGHCP